MKYKALFIDFDQTICDTSQFHGLHWKEFQQHIPQFHIYDGMVEFIQTLESQGIKVFIVSGNVESTIRKTITHFHLPKFLLNRISGYRYGMSMDNYKRKHKVITNALKENDLTTTDVIYLGDEENDYLVCTDLQIPCIIATWGVPNSNLDSFFSSDSITITPTIQDALNLILNSK